MELKHRLIDLVRGIYTLGEDLGRPRGKRIGFKDVELIVGNIVSIVVKWNCFQAYHNKNAQAPIKVVYSYALLRPFGHCAVVKLT